jgi:ArsR family transcriptional regulator, arsenate/arsenite/antimonite-responsive transcriptional repressor
MLGRSDVEQVVEIFKALSEEMRLRIMMLLTDGELCVCDLMAIFEEPQSKVSRHLAYLKHAGLIGSKRVGVWMHYFLKEPMDELAAAQLAFMNERLADLPRFKEDAGRMTELKKQKTCETAQPPARAATKKSRAPRPRNRTTPRSEFHS